MAKSFSRAGCKVALLDLRIDKAKKIEERLINSEGRQKETLSLELNVGIKKQHKKALTSIIEQFGDLHILINGAGINGSTPFIEIKEEEWDAIMDSQIKGTFFGCQVFRVIFS